MKIIKERVTVDIDEEFVVMLIGMRINKWWKIHKWLPIALAMRRMVIELVQRGSDVSGYLSGEYRTIGHPFIYVQYWRSYDDLERYATDNSYVHKKNWKRYFQNVGLNGDVGIWHESYKIKPGCFECVYLNMPPFGLGKISKLVPASHGRERSRERMERYRDKPNS
jgi:hypothetical protein